KRSQRIVCILYKNQVNISDVIGIEKGSPNLVDPFMLLLNNRTRSYYKVSQKIFLVDHFLIEQIKLLLQRVTTKKTY
ncbi:MAG: hypothetical protein ACQEWV_32390, partial [Bacillota bacterium]